MTKDNGERTSELNQENATLRNRVEELEDKLDYAQDGRDSALKELAESEKRRCELGFQIEAMQEVINTARRLIANKSVMVHEEWAMFEAALARLSTHEPH